MSLESILRRMINEANLNRGIATPARRLDGGLIIKIKLDKHQDNYTIYLSREGKTAPSQTEIKTFLEHWPIFKQEPTGFRSGVVFQIPIWPDEKGAVQ